MMRMALRPGVTDMHLSSGRMGNVTHLNQVMGHEMPASGSAAVSAMWKLSLEYISFVLTVSTGRSIISPNEIVSRPKAFGTSQQTDTPKGRGRRICASVQAAPQAWEVGLAGTVWVATVCRI